MKLFKIIAYQARLRIDIQTGVKRIPERQRTNKDSVELYGDGDNTLDEEGHNAFETSGQNTHIRERYTRRFRRAEIHLADAPNSVSQTSDFN